MTRNATGMLAIVFGIDGTRLARGGGKRG